jgi:putative methyltransferase (TIGR04325 family)
MKKIIKSLMPPIIHDIIKKLKISPHGWYGDYNNWEAATQAAIGYDTDEILYKVRESLLQVKNGNAIYERDSVLFNEIQYSWPLLSGLMLAAAHFGGVLHVLDFGGSLGSTYYQNKKFLDNLKHVSWNIVEQKKFIDIGKHDFENEQIHFYYDIESCIKYEHPNTLVMSSVLQYIENPYELLDAIFLYEFDYIIIDRTSFCTENRNKIKLQIVPSKIYNASYPCWFFDEKYFYQYFLSKKYSVIEIFEGADGSGHDYKFYGVIFKKNVL